LGRIDTLPVKSAARSPLLWSIVGGKIDTRFRAAMRERRIQQKLPKERILPVGVLISKQRMNLVFWQEIIIAPVNSNEHWISWYHGVSETVYPKR